ncbi:hypothetical protein ANO14919_140320 [Xylariales sp. No.14919]|nr:hypothetical protein ANO14919_140320 [Xylariales sp. No.14919]
MTMIFQFIVVTIAIISDIIKYIIDLRPLIDIVSPPDHHRVNGTTPPASEPTPGAESVDLAE